MARIVFLGLAITSSWGNGHATTYRGLVRALARRGHDVTFLERDVPWYAAERDLPAPPGCRTLLYRDLDELFGHAGLLRRSDLAVLGSYVPDGVAVGEWLLAEAGGVRAFYDIDTPVTLARLARGDDLYLAPHLVRGFDLYLSFTGGPTLATLERDWGARMARPLYCSVDPELYFPENAPKRWDMGYMGTWSADRQPPLDALLCAPAKAWPAGRFVVAGPQYPPDLVWPPNVTRIEHVAPGGHRGFYNAQRFTLNLTRADMAAAGHSPSVRLFEAAACAVPIVSDQWPGIETLFTPGDEIILAETPDQVLSALRQLPEPRRRALADAARRRVLAAHTCAHR
ncbi:MAG: glycosyltransferase, partial [Alphaproteobacteria bacterium]|nr:glycosyltransferase [Alphaproteobacteria bacterium]